MARQDNAVVTVTVTRNSVHILPDFFDAFRKDKTPLVIVDNNSRYGDREYLQYAANENVPNHIIKWLDANYLYSYAVNRGIEIAMKEYKPRHICLLNPDVMVKPGWYKQVISEMEEYSSASIPSSIAGCILLKDKNIIEHAGAYEGGEHYGRNHIYRPEDWQEVRNVPWVTGAFMMIDVDLFERIGLLDEEHYVHFGSDREFCKKASEQGFPTMCSPLALQHYYGWSTRPYIIHEDLPSIIQERIQKYGLGN